MPHDLAIGIDVGGSSVKAVVLCAGKVVSTGQSSRYVRPCRDQLVGAMTEAVASALHGAMTCGLANLESAAWRVGLCAPGLFDPSTRTIVRAVNVPGLVNVPIDDVVDQALGAAGLGIRDQVLITSDAIAAAFDVAYLRELRGRVFGLSIGTGVGAAVLDDGVPLRVAREGESPGHFGQVDVTLDDADPSTPIGPDGGRGGLEAYLGLHALIARYDNEQRLKQNLLDGFAGNDPPLRALARALRIAHAIYRPDHIVLLGGIGVRLSPSLEVLRAAVDSGLTSLARLGWTLGSGDDDHHAAAGAARLAFREHTGN